MIKVVFLVKRAEDITHDEFVRHLLEHHVPLALRHHPRLRKYSSAPIMPGTDNPGDFDAVAELYFDTVEDFRSGLFDSEDGRRVIAEDVARFCGRGGRHYITEEIVFKDETGSPQIYRPGHTVAALGGEALPGAGWSEG
ncbi:MAG TPA: EthD domain-containing protein [Acidimicrobiales bacterium]|nr:EthD domain-containing protein [Acidimicrobiales bacterium]